jgi:D-alanyl-lipoteichoic acid acyltransferase DltB (MBOAT superfamily)
MLFNSIDFAIFLPLVFFFYWFVTNKILKLQNIFIVIASYIFYGWWDWRFLALIIFSTFTDYLTGILLSRQENTNKRKILLWISIFINISFLGFFKYCNFFINNFIAAFSFFGMEFNPYHLNIVLPVGISFYTFQTMSYSIDVFKRKLEPTTDFISFAAFVSFFPQLVAGPIERARQLLPQFYEKRKFNYNEAIDGSLQILWGFFKKIVIADNCAIYVNMIFNNYKDYSGSTLFLGALFFSFQIYGDFSGYSDIALGTSRLFGISLSKNFSYPYFSRNMAEFWRRWHISLTTWFKDYVYIPLGGNRQGITYSIRNTFIIFILSGFWHGANWTFIVWGLLNAICFLPLFFLHKNRTYINIVAENKALPATNELFGILGTFVITTLLWVIFRAQNLNHAIEYITVIFSSSLFSIPVFAGRLKALITILLIAIFIIIEWIGRRESFAIQKIAKFKTSIMKYIVIALISFAILLFGNFGENPFIYFQF